ncbi:MAG: hypothetical protein JSV18_05905 [Candidatus Bathyarchaeota archaeon]|nr:MAG: hypothetical protein JSV18_05905 [Candidatus Bathyarchaeota archaeon]
MPTAGKVFISTEYAPLTDISVRLEGFKEEEVYEEVDIRLELVTEIANVSINEGILTGLYSYDYVVHNYHRGSVLPSPATKEVLFAFTELENRAYLTVVDKKAIANRLANRLSEIAFGEMGVIVEARILPETLKAFHLENPENTRVIFFENMDIPNINKLSLYGPDIVGTSLFEEYTARGDPWYILTKSKKHGHTVGLVRDGSVTLFNSVDQGQYLQYVREEILPMTQPPRVRSDT